MQNHANNVLRDARWLCRGLREHGHGRRRRVTASRLVASAASSPGGPQSSSPEQLPFSAGNSPSSSSASQLPEEKKPTFISRVVKPLQDFGFGKMAFMEGGVGLFVFAGIGTAHSVFVL